MAHCDNCDNEFNEELDGIVVEHRSAPVAFVCGGCVAGTRVIKMVLRRNDVGLFAYDQYTPIEMAKASSWADEDNSRRGRP